MRFRDLEEVWLPYSKDICDTQAYGEYTTSVPCLRHLAFTRPKAVKEFERSFTAPITGYAVNDELYVDLRFYDFDWYDQLEDVPDRFDKQYVLLYTVTAVTPKTLSCYCATFDEHWRATRGPKALTAYWCYAWGSIREFNPETMVLITPALCRVQPTLISSDIQQQQRVLRKHFAEFR